jgi:hypothetical protein
MNLKMLLVTILVGSLTLISACTEKSAENGTDTPGSSSTTDASGRCPHEIKAETCPFCNPALIESQGFCGDHGVAEALCAQCRPYLRAAFRAKGDWCQEHDGPDSQCIVCHPELKDNIRTGEHGGEMPS